MPTDLVTRARPWPGAGRSGPGGRSGGPGWRHGNGDGARPHGAAPLAANAAVCLGFALAGVVMLFVAFTMTYLGHRQDGTWTALPLSPILWVDTGLLLSASGALEWGRMRLRRGDDRGLAEGLTLAAALGTAFLLGQVLVWRQLAQHGVYLAGAPHSSFFYLLTGAHAVHLLAGLVVFALVVPRAWLGAYRPPAATAVTLTAVYWHFLAALWLYVFAVLFLI